MDFKATIDLIIRELEETCGILDDIARSPEAPVIEIELAKSKCRNAAGVIALLKNTLTEKKPVTADPIVNKPANPPSIQTETPEVKTEPTPPTANEPMAENRMISAKDNKAFPIVPPRTSADDNYTKEPDNKPFVAPIIADTFSHLARFNEQLGENDYSQGSPVSNLKDSIGLNDRFYYIREIFNGNRDEYEGTISRLENANDFNDARQIISSLNAGNRDNEAVKHLTDLVKRKFSK